MTFISENYLGKTKIILKSGENNVSVIDATFSSATTG